MTFKIGQRVRIARKVVPESWGDTWTDGMDRLVGTVSTITKIWAETDFVAKNPTANEAKYGIHLDCGYNWPVEALELADATPATGVLRPFSLEAAKEGHALITRNGRDATYVGYAEGVTDYPVAAVVNGGINAFTKEGFYLTDCYDNPSDLFMKPLCYVNDKPVYKGDILGHCNAGEIKVDSFDSSMNVIRDTKSVFRDPKNCFFKEAEEVTVAPKEVWTNLYQQPDGKFIGYREYDSQEAADAGKNRWDDYTFVGTICISKK